MTINRQIQKALVLCEKKGQRRKEKPRTHG
jgi:hypothetical protein